MTDQFSVTIRKNYLIPDKDAIRTMVGGLQEELKDNRELQERYKEDPRSFLGSRGLALPVQEEIMAEEGMPGLEKLFDCISTSSCCCTTLA